MMCKKLLWQSPMLRFVAAAHDETDGFSALESDTLLVRISKVLLLKNGQFMI